MEGAAQTTITSYLSHYAAGLLAQQEIQQFEYAVSIRKRAHQNACTHFFAGLGQVHPRHLFPQVSLLLVGGLTLFWTLFDLQNVINALITTRIVEQFVGQIVGVMLLRWREPDRPRPFRIWLYPLPCGLALVGWLYLYWAAGALFIGLGLTTLVVGAGVFLGWSLRTGQWPFASAD